MKHGHSCGYSSTKTYKAWCDMKQRCSNPKVDSYPRYGGRGIKVCARWRDSFENFLTDMGAAPPGMQIDRKNNDGNYTPSNCRWSTKHDQSKNRRTNRRLVIDGEKLCLADWAKRGGIYFGTILRRLELGWGAKRAVFERVKHSRRISR